MLDAVIVGSGTIGIAIGVSLASNGLTIGLYDNNPLRQNELLATNIDFDAKLLKQSITSLINSNKIVIVTQLATLPAKNYIICVPTPITQDGDLDTSHLDLSILELIKIAKSGTGIFIRSTVGIGMTRAYAQQAHSNGLNFLFAFTPDRSIEGSGFSDQASIPQLIGAIDSQSYERAYGLFSRVFKCINLRSPEAAEASKLFANSWRASTFAISNAMALICEHHGLDIKEIFSATSKDYPRFAPPLPGFVGGPCLPKDLKILKGSVPKELQSLWDGVIDSEALILKTITERLDAHIAQFQQSKLKVVLAGVAFKGSPEVNDTRGSLAKLILKHLKENCPSLTVIGWDPLLSSKQIIDCGMLAIDDFETAVKDAVLVVFCNNHEIFSKFDLQKLTAIVATGALFYDIYGICNLSNTSLSNDASICVLGRGLLKNTTVENA